MLGFSLNTLSLFGLILAIGLVVDDAIVVVEAVEHHIEHGLSPREATLKAMDEVTAPVIGIALVLSAVFVPVAFIPGITGRLYQQFALTIAISVLISAFNALTLSPALSALLLKSKHGQKGLMARFGGWFNVRFDRMTDGYVKISAGLVRKMVLSMGLLLAVALIAGLTGSRIPSGFVPDRGPGVRAGGDPAARCLLAAADARGGEEARGDPRQDPGRPELHGHQRIQPPHRHRPPAIWARCSLPSTSGRTGSTRTNPLRASSGR